MPVRVVDLDDASSIQKIYAYYVTGTSITFEVDIPSVDEMQQRIKNISAVYPWFVYHEGNDVKGYVYASRHRERAAFRWSVDFAVYVRPDLRGRGIGKILFREIIDAVTGLGYYNAFGVITIPNEQSVALHESCGFTCTGVTKNCGYKLGKWHDVGIWQLRLRESGSEPAEPEMFKNLL